MPVFNSCICRFLGFILLFSLSACGEFGVAAGPSENASARFEYKRVGATDKQKVEDGIDCGMDYFIGTLTIQFDKAEAIDACMRRKGYQPDFPSSDNERRVWTLE